LARKIETGSERRLGRTQGGPSVHLEGGHQSQAVRKGEYIMAGLEKRIRSAEPLPGKGEEIEIYVCNQILSRLEGGGRNAEVGGGFGPYRANPPEGKFRK